MGVDLCGIVAVGEIKPSENIVHFYKDANTLIFLDESYWSVLDFSTICEAGLLYEADFTADEHVDELIQLLQGRTFIVFYYSEWADLTDQEYGVVFKDGVYSHRTENIYNEFLKLGLSFEFMHDHSFWSYERAKRTYITANKKGDGIHNG